MDKENDYCYDPQHDTYDTEDPAFLFLESEKTEYYRDYCQYQIWIPQEYGDDAKDNW